MLYEWCQACEAIDSCVSLMHCIHAYAGYACVDSCPHLHSGQASTPCCAGECLHVGCRQVVQGMPSLVLEPTPTCNNTHNTPWGEDHTCQVLGPVWLLTRAGSTSGTCLLDLENFLANTIPLCMPRLVSGSSTLAQA
jgi:hypothetical protein